MRKKVLALLMATAMVASLAGCGDKTTTGTESQGSTPASTESKPADNTGDTTVETKDVALTVWAPSEDQAEDKGNWLQTMCEQFNAAHPEWNITFTYGVCAEGDAKATVTQDVEAAADVYMFANDNL